MADDVSKKYALNIEVNVDSSSLNNLKNIQEPSFQITSSHQEDVFEKLYDSPKVQSKQTQQIQHSLGDIKELSTKLSEMSNKVDGIKSELEKRDTSRHSEHITNASNLATSDIARSVAVQIMSAINDGISPVLSSGMFKTSHMSAGETQAYSKSGKIDSSGIQKKIAATTGKKVTVHESQMSNGEYGEYEHSSQSITINRSKSTPVKKLALNHEATHTVQEAKGYTGNTQLFHANANTSEFYRNQSKYVNEYLTNTAAIIRTALTNGLDEPSLKQAVEAYENAISKTSGVVIKDIKSFTDTILKMSSLNISPETFMSNFGNDVVGLGNNGMTNLSKAAALVGYHTKSDGSIRNQNGKIISDNKLLRLTDEDGKRINQSDIASHRMAYFVSNSANKLRGVSKFNGMNAFLRSAGTEFLNMSDFGIQFMPEERLERINSRRQWQGLSYSDIQRRIRENTAYTHREQPLYTEEEVIRPIIRDKKTGKVIGRGSSLQTRLKNPGNVRLDLKSPVEKILFSSGGNDALSEVNGMSNLSSLTKNEIYEIVKSYIFKGTGRNPLDFESETVTDTEGRHGTSQLVTNYGALMGNINSSIERYLSNGDTKNIATFIGTNRLNASLGDTAFLIRAAKRGLKQGRIPADIKRVQTLAPEEHENSDGEKLNTLDNASVGHLMSEQLSQGEEMDLRDYEMKRLAYDRYKKAIASAREKFNALRLGGSSNAGLINASGSAKIMIGRRQVSSIEDIDRIERRIESEFANYQRESPEIAKKEAYDNMLTALKGIIGVLHGGEDTRKISTEQLLRESEAVIAELNAIPDFIINRAKKRNSTIKLDGVDVGVDGIIKTREAIKEYHKTMRNISSGEVFSTSKMAEEEYDATKDLEDIKRKKRNRRIELAKDHGFSKEEANSNAVMAPILRKDPEYRELQERVKQLEAYLKRKEESDKNTKAEQKRAKEKYNADLQIPTSYRRKVNGETVERNVKFDKNEASVMGSMYEKDYGAYNMAVGNLEALSTTTQAPLEILKKIRKNRSYMSFVGEDGNIKDFASPLTSAMSPEAILRMRMLENPLKRVLETSGSISGNAPKRIDATRDMLADYLHRGESEARHQLGSLDEFISKFKSLLVEYRAKNTDVNQNMAKELYSAIRDFNERSILAKSGLPNIDASTAKRTAEESAGKDVLHYVSALENRMLRGDTRGSYSKEIEKGKELLEKFGIVLSAPVTRDYDKKQYKLVSDLSLSEGDIASGSAVKYKRDMIGAAKFLTDNGREINPFLVTYKDGLSAANIDLGDLTGIDKSDVAKMVRAAQMYGFENTDAELVNVSYRKNRKKDKKTGKYLDEWGIESTETTARSNDAILSSKNLSIKDAFKGKELERDAFLYRNDKLRGGIPFNNDVVREFSDNMRKIVERALNGGASSETIKRIAEDVSAIKGILSNVNITTNSVNTKKSGGMFETSKMSAEDSAINDSIEAERRRRIEAAKNIENEYSDLYEDETANRIQQTGIYDTSAQKRLEKSEFEAKLSELSSKREKLALIDEKINSMNSEMDSMTNEDRLKSQTEINRLRKKRVAIENGPGTKEDKIEFNEWRDALRSQQREFISKLKGKGSEDISRVVSEEIKRLLNLEENRSAGNYDKKLEIQKLTTKLKEFEQSSRIKNDKNLLSDAINELKRKYKGEDNAFDATIKGAGIDDRPEKLRKEVERLNLVLDELKVKKEEALNAGDDASAKFYDTLIFQRQIRKDVVQGKQNAADKSLRIADENAAARALKEAERARKQEQKSLDAMAAAHDKEGNQARSVFNKAVEYGAMSTLVYGFASEAKNAIDIMSRFERQMVEVTKVMDPLYKSQELLTESAKRMAVQYGVSIIESAKGMSVFAQQGKNAAQIIQLTEASLLAANTTTLNAAQATEALTATIRQFNLTDSDAKRVIDSWLEVESRTAISAQTMADAIKISGTAARVAGLSFDEFNGILSAVGSATRETGSQLGTAFKFIISKMRTDDAVTALNRLGVATHNQNGDYRDLMVVLSDLNSKWVKMSQEQKASTAIAIAGTRRYNTLMTLMEKWDDALDAVSMSEDSHGKAMRMNAAIMDTYEKKVQKARASVEAFYASMSKGTTKGFLGGIQESISMFAGMAEKTPLASSLAQAGVVASGINFFSRIGGSMGLGTALGDLKANSEIKSEISKAIASEVKSSIGNGKALFRSEASRRAVLERLDIIDSGKNVSSEMNKDSKFLDGRDVLAKKITERIAGVNEKSELYQSTLKRVQDEISRTISSHKEYIEKLDKHKNGVARFGIAAGEFAKKHAAVIAAIGIGLQTLANSEFFKDEKSLTGKTTTGEVIDLAGSLGTAIGAGAAASRFGGPWAGVAVGALSMLGPLVSNLKSWGEKINGSTRLTLLRLQEESDRLKTLTTSIDSYSRLREKERSGQALTLEEQEQKRVLEQNISLASPTAIKIGHRGIGSYLDEGEFEKLVGRKTEFKDKYASISDQMAYEQMFSQTFGGKTISDDLRKNLFTEQKALEVQLSKLRDFDAKHTGELSESEHSARMKIIEEIKKIQERVGKGNTAINEVEQAFFASVRNRESGVLNATRRGESYEANDGPNDRIRKMFEQIVANRNGNISEAIKVTSEAILSGIISRGIIKNRTTSIEHAQRTGMLYSATRGRELEGGKQEIILHTRAADGSVRKSESIVMDKKGSDDDYIREVATRKGLDARSIAYTSELSDTLFRYSLKEVEKFSELTRKIGDTIYNSYKNEVDRISSIEGISSKFRIGGIDSQYRGSNTRLEEALRATLMRTKSAGTVDSELIKKMADYAKNNNPSKAMFAGAEISSQIARHNTLAGATEHLVMSMSTQVQKANMANQIIEAIYKASFKTERGRDGEVADIGGEEKKRINEYLAMAGLGFDEFDKIRESLSGASEEDFKRALISRVSAAADIMAKKDSNDISKYFKLLEDNVERLANIMKQTAEAIEINRKDSFAANLDYSGMVFDRDIVNSYKSMAKHASMYDDEITRLSAIIEASRNGVDIQKNAVDQALKTRDEVTAKYGKDSQQAITANDNYLRLRNNYDQALSSLNISLEKLDNLRGLQQQLKAMTTGSFGEHRAFMRAVVPSAIGESTRNGNISFGTGSSDYNNISILAEQNKILGDRRMDIQSQYDAYAQMAKDGKLTEAQKTEMKSLELQLGEIDKAIRENGMRLDTANMNLEKTYAEARRNTRRLQLEHLANALSGSKDTGRSQKAMFDDNYNRMRGLWRDYVSAMQQNPNAVSEDQKQYMKELAKKMENLRDIGDLMGNPAFNKNYLLASAQDQAIADNIMQRLQSGETMRQIFSDAGMKEMGRNNPLISQLMDNMMQKQENQRLADVSNQMLDVETEMLGYLRNISGLMNDPMFRTKIEEGGKSNRDAKKGFANGTTFTGSGGKFESAGIVEVHKGEGLGVLSQTAMARYPMMSRKVLQMISDMNTGTYPGFSNGTRTAGSVFNFGSRDNILGLSKNAKIKLYIPDDNLRKLANIMRIDTNDMWTTANGKSASDKIGGFNQGGKIFINGGAGRSTAVHEIVHGANGSQFGGYNTGREAMSVFTEMAIGGTKTPGYGNFFTRQAYSGLNLGLNPAKNAQAIFDTLGKNGNYKYQWEGINSGLRGLSNRYLTSELGTVDGNRDFKHGYAQAASVVAEYAKNTGTSSQRDIDRMYTSLERLFKKVTGSSTIDFVGHSGEKFNVKEFASACADFRASVDKNSKVSSNEETLATIERRARQNRDQKQVSRESSSELKERVREIKEKNYGNVSGQGVTFRGGKWRNYGPIEKLIQSDVGAFFRDGGVKNLSKRFNTWERNLIRNKNLDGAKEAFQNADSRFNRAANELAEANSKRVSAKENLRQLKSGQINPETRIERDLKQRAGGQRYLAERNSAKIAKIDARIKAETDAIRTATSNRDAYVRARDGLTVQYGTNEKEMSTRTRREYRILNAKIAKEEASIRASSDTIAKMRKNQVGLEKQQRGLDYRADRSQYKLDAYRTNPVREIHQRAEAVLAARDAQREARVAGKNFDVATSERTVARDNYTRELERNIRNIRINIAPGRILKKVGGTVDNFAGSATNAAFAMMNLKGAVDNGKMFFTGKRFNKDTGEYEALTDFEKGQARFNAASNAAFFTSQAIGGKYAKASGIFGGAGSALSMASAVHNMANGNVAQGSLQVTQAAMFNPQLRNFVTNQLGKTAFGQKVLQKMPRMGRGYGYGAALQMGGNLLASQFKEGSNAWVASKLASEAGTVMQFMSPAGAALALGMNGINEFINLGDDEYKLQTGQALEALSRRNGDSGSWYSTSTLGYFSDTLLGGLIGTRERAHRAAAADMKSQAAADAINKNIADYNKALKTSRDVRFGDNVTMAQKAQDALAAVELQNSFFKHHTGLKDDKLIDKDSASILAMTGVGVDNMFKKYGWSDNNIRIANSSKNAAKHKAEAEMHRQNAKSRTVSKAWGQDEKDRVAAKEAEAAALTERIESQRTVLGTVKNDDLQKEARVRTQDYFDNKYGKKADVYGEKGLLVQVRRAKRDEEIKIEQKNLADQKRKISEARNDFFKKNTRQFSYSSLEELEHRARLGDGKAVEELKIFNEKSKSHTFSGKTISEMQEGVKGAEKKIGELSGKRITSDGKITAEEFLKMDALANKDYGVRIKQNSKERENVASKLKEAEEDLKNMEGVSGKEAIARKKAEIEAYKKRLGKHDEADLALKTGRAIEERIKGGKLVNPKKLASDVSDMGNEARDAQAALDNEKVLREIKKNGKATVKINGKDREVTRNDLVNMADRDGSRRAAKRKAFEDAVTKVKEETNVEFVRQQLIKENGGDASKVTDDIVKARMAQNKERARKEAEKKLVSNIDTDYKGQNGGMSFAQLEEEERKERRKITLDNIGLKKIKYNKETRRYEAEDDKKANTPSVDERTESLGGEDTKQIADAFGGGPRTAGVSGTSQTTAGDDKNIGEISRDTAAITETLAKVLEKMGEILKLIPNTSDHASEKNTPPKEGDRIPT